MFELEQNWWVLGIMAGGLASLHLAFIRIDAAIRRREALWMGIIGGVAAGYVVLHLLPKIAGIAGVAPKSPVGFALAVYDLWPYYVLLAGVVTYLCTLALDRMEGAPAGIARGFDFAVHGAYSALVGYVFVELSSSHAEVNGLVAVILGAHLLGMNHILRGTRREGFDAAARWVLFLLVLAGTAVGLATEIPARLIYTVTAFLAGIILVNVISEELPLRHQNRLPWFLVGVSLYLIATLLIARLDPVLPR